MAQNEQVVEVVTFKADGLEQIAEGAKKLADNTGALTQKYGQFAGTVEKAARRNELFARAMRDGTYERHVRTMGKLNAEYAQLERRAEAVARYGPRLGAIMSNPYVRGAARVGMYAGGAALAAGAGLARSGFGGTVESNRLELETKLLGREVAGAMKPFTDGITNATVRLRKWMEGLSASSQNMIMYGGLLATGLVGLRALIGAQAFGALAVGGAKLAGRALGIGGAGAGGSGAALAAGAAGGAAAGAGRSLLARAGGFLARNAPKVPLVGAAVGGATSGDYGRLRAEGMGRGKAAFLSMFMSGGEMVQSLTGDNEELGKWREKLDKKHGLNDHRKVMNADAGFEAVGSGYDRLSTALALVDASAAATREEAATGGTALIAAMAGLTEAVRAASAGADPTFRPASGRGPS